MATPSTGQPRGRPKGAKSKRTLDRQRAVQDAVKAIEASLPESFDGDAHALLMLVYKDVRLPLGIRLDAAKTAIGYEKPRLANTELNASIRQSVADFTDAELAVLADQEGGGGGACEA